jgi:4-hydroxymandelate oxidase
MAAGATVTHFRALAAAPKQETADATEPRTPFQPVSVPDYELLARERMTHEAWEFITSGCGDDVTLRWNREALTRLRVEPRVMVDVTHIDTKIRLFGREFAHPLLLAPTAAHMLVHPEGEVATARGAAAAGAIMVLSTVSNRSVAEVASNTSQPLWFQLYIQKDRGLTKELIQRADAAGVHGLCITVDLPVSYTRDRVEHVKLRAPTLPFPNVNMPAVNGMMPRQGQRDTKLTWKDLDWIRSFSSTRILLKGILHPNDAEQAVNAGVDGIIVSNHGGRALDSAPATIDALPRVVERVAGRMPVLMDGGIRRGTDVLKALAFGANAVLIGRPYLFGLAVNGADGVRHVIEILRTELEGAMALTGRTSIARIDRSVLWKE